MARGRFRTRQILSWSARWMGAGVALICLLAIVLNRWGHMRIGDQYGLEVQVRAGALAVGWLQLGDPAMSTRARWWDSSFHLSDVLVNREYLSIYSYRSRSFRHSGFRPWRRYVIWPETHRLSPAAHGVNVIAVPLWIPLAMAGAASGWAWRSRRRAGDCRDCGYDLTGLPAEHPCPECGRARAARSTTRAAG